MNGGRTSWREFRSLPLGTIDAPEAINKYAEQRHEPVRQICIKTEVFMSVTFLSTLEIRYLIERALLPDLCTCECRDGRTLNLTLQKLDDPEQRVVLNGIPLESLQSSRSLANLIAEARALLMQSATQRHWGNGSRAPLSKAGDGSGTVKLQSSLRPEEIRRFRRPVIRSNASTPRGGYRVASQRAHTRRQPRDDRTTEQ